MIKVQVGQIYKDGDPRYHGKRTLQVIKVMLVTMPTSKKGNYGNSAEFADCDVYMDGEKTGTTTIHTARMMKDTKRGYKLMNVHELPKRELELKHADVVAVAVDDLLEASSADIGFQLGILKRAHNDYRKVRIGL